MTNDERDVINVAIYLECDKNSDRRSSVAVARRATVSRQLVNCQGRSGWGGGRHACVHTVHHRHLHERSNCTDVVRPTGLGDYCTFRVGFVGCKLSAEYLATILCNVNSLQMLS